MSGLRKVAKGVLGWAMMGVWVLVPALPIMGLLVSRMVGVR